MKYLIILLATLALAGEYSAPPPIEEREVKFSQQETDQFLKRIEDSLRTRKKDSDEHQPCLHNHLQFDSIASQHLCHMLRLQK